MARDVASGSPHRWQPALRTWLNAVMLALITAPTVAAQDLAEIQAKRVADSVRTVELVQQLRAIEERNRTFKFGLSVGWRHILGERSTFYRDAVLNPADSTVQVDSIDAGDVVLSAVVVAYPWKMPDAATDAGCCGVGTWLWRLGFIANVDLASFGSDQVVGFNHSIEGGGGVAWRLASDFSAAFTVERVFSRRLREYVKPGQKLPVPPQGQVEAFGRTNDVYFRNDNLTALSLKFVYFLR